MSKMHLGNVNVHKVFSKILLIINAFLFLNQFLNATLTYTTIKIAKVARNAHYIST